MLFVCELFLFYLRGVSLARVISNCQPFVCCFAWLFVVFVVFSNFQICSELVVTSDLQFRGYELT